MDAMQYLQIPFRPEQLTALLDRGKKSIFKLGFGTNPYSLYAFGAGALLLGLVIFIPGLHRLFQVQSMPVVSLLQVAVLAFIPTLMIQMKRLICKK